MKIIKKSLNGGDVIAELAGSINKRQFKKGNI